MFDAVVASIVDAVVVVAFFVGVVSGDCANMSNICCLWGLNEFSETCSHMLGSCPLFVFVTGEATEWLNERERVKIMQIAIILKGISFS